jgi:hypothetical protein
MAPLSSLHAAITIVVKKRLVNSITYFFHFVGRGSAVVAAGRQRWRRQQHGSSGQLGSGGSSFAVTQF